jgi:hypothetical protein
LQTHAPEHPLLHVLISGGYPAFAASELDAPEEAGFPPFAHLALLRAESQQVVHAQDFLQTARACLEAAMPGGGVELHGLMPHRCRAGPATSACNCCCPARERRPLHAMLDTAMPLLHDLPEARKVRAGRSTWIPSTCIEAAPTPPRVEPVMPDAASVPPDRLPRVSGPRAARALRGDAGAPAVPLPRPSQLGGHRPHRRLELSAAGLVVPAGRARVLPDRLPRPLRGIAELGTGLLEPPARARHASPSAAPAKRCR